MAIIENELECMTALDGCNNIVKHFKSFHGKENIYIVMEFCSGGDLAHFLFNKKSINVKQTFQQIARSVQQCHHNYIAHR